MFVCWKVRPYIVNVPNAPGQGLIIPVSAVIKDRLNIGNNVKLSLQSDSNEFSHV